MTLDERTKLENWNKRNLKRPKGTIIKRETIEDVMKQQYKDPTFLRTLKEDEIIKRHKKGLTNFAISLEMGIGESSVWRTLRKHGISRKILGIDSFHPLDQAFTPRIMIVKLSF